MQITENFNNTTMKANETALTNHQGGIFFATLRVDSLLRFGFTVSFFCGCR